MRPNNETIYVCYSDGLFHKKKFVRASGGGVNAKKISDNSQGGIKIMVKLTRNPGGRLQKKSISST